MAYRKLATLNELPEGALIEVVQGEDLYALCNVGGEVRAIAGVCPHNGGPLGQGALDGSVVSCPWHAYEFDSATGTCLLDDALNIATYPVRVEADDILIDLPDA